MLETIVYAIAVVGIAYLLRVKLGKDIKDTE